MILEPVQRAFENKYFSKCFDIVDYYQKTVQDLDEIIDTFIYNT